MSDPVEHAVELMASYSAELERRIPAGCQVFDAHLHCGTDIDGTHSPLEEVLAFLRHSGASRAFCFCLDEPDRHPAFRAANDRTLEAAAQSDGVLIPFARLDLAEGPVEEATRCLDRGAFGIKLHPRAQAFLLNDERLDGVFALAAERRAPILIHGGRGLPPVADDLLRLVERYPDSQLIIAHGGIADLAALADAFAGHEGVFFDTSLWGVVDLLDLYSRVSPEQLLYASDFPYGGQPAQLLLDLRIAELAGFSREELEGILGLNAGRIADREDAPPLSPPKLGSRAFRQPIAMARIHTYLTMATPLLWTRQPDTIGALGLALNAAAEQDGQAEVREQIADLLTCARDLWVTSSDIEDEAERVQHMRLAFRLVHLADIEALTAQP